MQFLIFINSLSQFPESAEIFPIDQSVKIFNRVLVFALHPAGIHRHQGVFVKDHGEHLFRLRGSGAFTVLRIGQFQESHIFGYPPVVEEEAVVKKSGRCQLPVHGQVPGVRVGNDGFTIVRERYRHKLAVIGACLVDDGRRPGNRYSGPARGGACRLFRMTTASKKNRYHNVKKEEEIARFHDRFSAKLKIMLKMITDLSNWINFAMPMKNGTNVVSHQPAGLSASPLNNPV